jgi:rhamnogalacturonan endolyase
MSMRMGKWAAIVGVFIVSFALPRWAPGQTPPAPVTVTATDVGYVLDNGIVRALVSSKSGDLISLQYKGKDMLATVMGPDGQPDLKTDPPGANTRGFAPFTDHQYGFWSHDTTSPNTTARISIDPATNNGDRAEVAMKGLSNGNPMGAGPGGGFISDIEIRYALGRGDSGVYTYSIFEHQPDYPNSTLGEARFCAKLNSFFDWMLVDQHHNFLYPASAERGDDKYNYTTVQFEHPAFGFASTTANVGFFIVNPSAEYLTGPPTKVEFECHRDTNAIAAPCVLNYWRSSHYGGGSVDVAKGEHWTKVIGPFLLYCNSGGNPQVLWADAIAQADREKTKWPYDWVDGVDYPHRDQRGTVSGRLVLNDPGLLGDTASAASLNLSDKSLPRLRVGLSHPDYTIPLPRPAAVNSPRDIDWQTDAKYYEFWVRGDADGSFTIPNVRPGDYTLHAIADGVLGEYAQTNITVEAGKSLDLGVLQWTPVRHGKQIWQIGVPNRSGSKFAKGDDYFHDGMAGVYAKLFPNDVHFVIGKSDPARDWFFEQVPHVSDAPAAPRPTAMPTISPGTTRPAARGFGRGGAPAIGKATPWTISFDMPDASHGAAMLRLGIATCNTREIDIAVNDQPTGKLSNLPTDSSIGRNGIQGLWYERDFPFDASLLKAGTNSITLTVPAGGPTAGVIYDCVRLELDDKAAPAASAQ